MISQAMIKAQIQATASGAILFDSAQMADAAEHWFEQGADADGATRAGRGEVVFFDAPFGACVLRHDRRGGLSPTSTPTATCGPVASAVGRFANFA